MLFCNLLCCILSFVNVHQLLVNEKYLATPFLSTLVQN